MTENEIGTTVIGRAIEIHRGLGPGLFETVYEVLLAHELKEAGLEVERQVRIPIEWKGIRFEEGFRADLIVANKVLVELKAVRAVENVHKKQVLTYLRLTGLKLGSLINFNEEVLRDGVTRIANGLEERKI